VVQGVHRSYIASSVQNPNRSFALVNLVDFEKTLTSFKNA